MTKTFLIGGISFAGLAVIFGAFGAHALKERISQEQLLVFETGVRYQFYHSLALIILFLLGEKLSPSLLQYSGVFFIIGIILFSGSLYLLSTREMSGIENWKSVLGPVTPLGGLCFIIGWTTLLFAALKS